MHRMRFKMPLKRCLTNINSIHKGIVERLIVALTYIGDIIAYQHGLHFCEEVYPYRNQNKI